MKRSPEQIRSELTYLNLHISLAALWVEPFLPLIEEFEKEAADMESFGPVMAPALFLSPMRKIGSEVLLPVYLAARQLVRAVEESKRRMSEIHPPR